MHDFRPPLTTPASAPAVAGRAAAGATIQAAAPFRQPHPIAVTGVSATRRTLFSNGRRKWTSIGQGRAKFLSQSRLLFLREVTDDLHALAIAERPLP
jgi:hypothetical protein